MSDQYRTENFKDSHSVLKEDIQNISDRKKKSVETESKIVRVKDAPEHISVSKSHYFNLKNPKSKYFQSDFPRTVLLSDNCKGHYRSELDAWLDSKEEGGEK